MSPPPNDAVAALEDVLGPESAREIVGLFLKDFPDSVRLLASEGHGEQLRIVHGMKSSARHMGAAALAARMAGLEARLHGGQDTLGHADLAGAIADFGIVEPSLRRYAAGKPA
jgi:HPt (histidine-containing phosphotransfer) domain-containing protein